MGARTLAAIGVAATLGLSTMGQAHAGANAKAYSSLFIEDFIVTDGNGNQLDRSAFDILGAFNDGTNTATLDGNNAIATDSGAADIDSGLACVGPSCDDPDGDGAAENDFDQQEPVGDLHFSRGDSFINGSSITGQQGASQDNVDANTVAESHLRSTATGQASSEIGSTSGFSFSMNNASQVGVSFSGTPFLDTRLHADTQSGNARARVAWGVTIEGDEDEDGVAESVLNWTPDGQAGIGAGEELNDPLSLNNQISVTTPGNQRSFEPGTGSFSARTANALDPGVTYDFTIQHSGSVRTNKVVPEPHSLVLLGVGLLGLGAVCRRQYLKA